MSDQIPTDQEWEMGWEWKMGCSQSLTLHLRPIDKVSKPKALLIRCSYSVGREKQMLDTFKVNVQAVTEEMCGL